MEFEKVSTEATEELLERLREVVRQAVREELQGAGGGAAVLRYGQAARALNCSVRKVRRLVATGEIGTCLVGKRPMIPRTEIERMARASTPQRRPRPGRPRAETYSPADEAAKSKALRAAKRRA